MPTYQLIVYQFDPLVGGPVRIPGGDAGPVDLTGTLQALRTVGASFRPTGAVGTRVVVAESDGGRVLTADPDIPERWRGAVLQVEARLQVADGAAAGHVVEMFLVRIGAMAGLASADPLDPAATYRVQDAVDLRDAATGADWDRLACEQLACLTHGTQIDTPDGPRLIETLRPGDLVTTLDNGSQPVRWVGQRAIPAQALVERPGLRPVRFEADTIGNARPLLVSPQHRMLLADWRAQVYFGEEQVLIAARALVNGLTIRQVVPEAGVTYCHLLFDRHEVILTEGALAESFHPGEAGLERLDAATRHEIESLFPHTALGDRRAAFPIVQVSEVQGLPFAL